MNAGEMIEGPETSLEANPPEILEAPLRSELYTLEQLKRHAQILARTHEVTFARGGNLLLARLGENEKILRDYNQETTLVEKQRQITPAAEWMLDNFYLIREQIHLARRHLPRRYNRQLPKLRQGPMQGYPRVYDIAFELITHVDGRLDTENLNTFISAYQTVHLLTLGELWAIPIMLRLALVENLRRIAVHLGTARKDRDLAGKWAARLIEVCENHPSKLVIAVSELAQSSPSVSSAFVAEFCRRLEAQNPSVLFARNWLEHRVAENGHTIEQLVQSENQLQASDQVSVGNSITSLRFIGSMDWREFVETFSLVELLLLADPAGIHSETDFATRDRCRHAVETLARQSGIAEIDVASTTVDLAKKGLDRKSVDRRTGHVGYYLLYKGRTQLEQELKLGFSWPSLFRRLRENFPIQIYVGSILALTMLLLFYLLHKFPPGTLEGWRLPVFCFLAFIALSQLASAFFNWFITLMVTPRPLPRMDYSGGIPAGARTMVAIPTMLSSLPAVENLLEGLEVRYLANRDDNLYFALLTDFTDSQSIHTPEDELLLARMRDGILQLNQKYQEDRPGIFYLFHRPRRWNEKENRWMGYERKRGKLAEFNALLRRKGENRFSEIIGDKALLGSIKYVITLDTDTQLPGEAARELVATIHHPLNRPVFDPVKQRVVEGYSILQPRVGVSLPSATRSWFVKMFASEVGIDPYTRAVSDIYQDLFQEGSYIGKGIYDVDFFEKALANRFPENTVLSHDLLESCHARSALVSDIQLFEEHPSRYIAEVNRRHRWIRGDWQIAAWLLPRVPGPDARSIINPLSGLSLWKIFDNLRRSLVPTALLLLLIGSWYLAAEASALWTRTVLLIVAMPGLFQTLMEFIHKPDDRPVRMHLRSSGGSFASQGGQAAMTLIFLPFDAYSSLDAIIRTLYRLIVTRRGLLEWQTASEAEKTTKTDLPAFFASMWIAPALAAAVGLSFYFTPMPAPPWALPILALWIVSPLIAWWISRPLEKKPVTLTLPELLFMRKVARKNWRFFETFVSEEDKWLPPDNFQEQPTPVIASRTSPTNIGLSLLANLGAQDFGYLSAETVLNRTEKTMATLRELERFRGHFYNWYDTRSLKPLFPLYVSTVDSGNLAACLLVLRQGLLELIDQPIINPRSVSGAEDAFLNLEEAYERYRTKPESNESAGLAAGMEQLRTLLRGSSNPGSNPSLHEILKSAQTLHQQIPKAAAEEMEIWIEALERTCRDHLEERDRFKLENLLPYFDQAGSNSKPAKESPMEQSSVYSRLSLLEFLQSSDQLLSPGKSDGGSGSASGENLPETKSTEPFLETLRAANQRAKERMARIYRLAEECASFAEMDFTFLYDPSRNLFAIGFNVSDHRRDTSFYDLLASEARLSSFVAIAQGQVRQKHWFSLGRLLTSAAGEPALVSWSGSMFEYLMPMLVMPTYDGTLLDQTCRAAVRRQIQYGAQRGVPWGISESGYNLTDVHLNYQYRAFGVPGLGLKRGLAEDLVIAPYACALGFMVEPRKACENLQRLAAEDHLGPYGFYEAVDYTEDRVPPGQKCATVQSYMAHHQGMSFLAFAYVLLDRPFQRRFFSDPIFKASELLLQERVPKNISAIYPHEIEVTRHRNTPKEETSFRVISNPNTVSPELHLLSNGRYHVMVTASGAGYSRWKDLAVTRWKEDPTRDCWGSFCFIRDLETDQYWSATHQPTLQSSPEYQAVFMQARAEFRQRLGELDSRMEISVSPEDDIELRRILLTNRSRKKRSVQLTSYAEVVLAPPAADAAHPAFSNLFVQTKLVPSHHAILCTRRPRSQGEVPPWIFHLMLVRGGGLSETSFETDRSQFLGRGNSLQSPQAMTHHDPLNNSEGSVLDPIMSIRRNTEIKPDGTVEIDLITGIAESEAAALRLVQKYHDHFIASRVMELAWTHSQVVLRHLNATETDAQIFGRLAGSLIYANPQRRAPAPILAKNVRGQNFLWSYGISGDLPIALLMVSDASKMALVRQVVQAHAYWRLKGLQADLVILNEDDSVYRQSLHEQIIGLVSSSAQPQMLDRSGGIFVRRIENMSPEDRILLQSVARLILSDRNGSLATQAERRQRLEPRMPPMLKARSPAVSSPAPKQLSPPPLEFFNGFGGFTADGKEYVMVIEPGKSTPAPWVNVLANPNFGTLISERGSAYTWAENCHEFRLTPWSNDPVSDPSGEVFYIRDEQTSEFWTPTPGPRPGKGNYLVRHGFGYSTFEHSHDGIASTLTVFVPLDASVKLVQIRLRNTLNRPRHLSVVGYWEWVLGELRTKAQLHLVPEMDAETGVVFFRNPFNADFSDRVAFADMHHSARSLTIDRAEFLGRHGSTEDPVALHRLRLSGKMEAGLDPCTALQGSISLLAGEEKEIVFCLGSGKNRSEALSVIQRFRKPGAPAEALRQVRDYWQKTLGVIQVETPDQSVNFLANGWLLYQTLSCRLWARTGFYQSGGAYGFRDQLQDVMALVYAEPQLYREHLLRAAAHQFLEGDVQHWWHPPQNRGVRTHFSDDYLWLPYAACRYVQVTGDFGVLNEKIPFLEGRPVKPDEESYYDLPQVSGVTGTLYEHCVRAIRNGLRFGSHGLPLMGCGDWNDGMNLVGEHGKGESVWLGFFLYDVLGQFGELAHEQGDAEMEQLCRTEAARLRENIEENAWDGEWYRRAYFDNGEPLGSAKNAECQIDALPQAWSLLSGAGDPERSRRAMEAVHRRLVRRDARLIQLFTPPFDQSHQNPGYIKGYVPGVRENGGQYTHAAIWTVMGFAHLGEPKRAWELFNLVNPLNHGKNSEDIAVYKVEPYVVAADVYAVSPHTSRGGWTWYTGSAGWLYRLIVESLLGLQIKGNRLTLRPCLPETWTNYVIRFQYHATSYRLEITKPPNAAPDWEQKFWLDGQALSEPSIELKDDGRSHEIKIALQAGRELLV